MTVSNETKKFLMEFLTKPVKTNWIPENIFMLISEGTFGQVIRNLKADETFATSSNKFYTSKVVMIL